MQLLEKKITEAKNPLPLSPSTVRPQWNVLFSNKNLRCINFHICLKNIKEKVDWFGLLLLCFLNFEMNSEIHRSQLTATKNRSHGVKVTKAYWGLSWSGSDMSPKTGKNLLPKHRQPTELAEKARQFTTGTIHLFSDSDICPSPNRQQTNKIINEQQYTGGVPTLRRPVSGEK